MIRGIRQIEDALQCILSKKMNLVTTELDIFGGSRPTTVGFCLFM